MTAAACLFEPGTTKVDRDHLVEPVLYHPAWPVPVTPALLTMTSTPLEAWTAN